VAVGRDDREIPHRVVEPTGDLADGVVVGTRAVEVADEGADALSAYVRSLRDALDA